MATAGAFFVVVLCVIRGCHVYKEAWNPSIADEINEIKHGDKIKHGDEINTEITLLLLKVNVFQTLDMANKLNF